LICSLPRPSFTDAQLQQDEITYWTGSCRGQLEPAFQSFENFTSVLRLAMSSVVEYGNVIVIEVLTDIL